MGHRDPEGMTLHPACELFPPMSPEEFAALKDSIYKNGQREPVMVLDDEETVVDGRHRVQACAELKLAVWFEVWTGEGLQDSILDYVLDKNRHRRHLNQGQLALLAVQAADYAKNHEAKPAKKAKGSKVATLPPSAPPSKTREQLAESVGVSPRLIGDAKKVAQDAPELAEKVKAGDISLNEAKRQMKVPPPPMKGAPPVPGQDDLAKAARFTDLATRIHAIKREVLALAEEPVGRELRGQQVEAHFQNIATALRSAAPHALCACKGDAKCKVCDGMGWVTKEQHERQQEAAR